MSRDAHCPVAHDGSDSRSALRRAGRAAAALTVAGLAAMALSGCAPARPPVYFPITLRVVSESRAMSGVHVLLRDRDLGLTDNNGLFQMRTLGQEGALVELTVRCPAGFQPETQNVSVPLRQAVSLAGQPNAAGIETTVNCPPTQRIAAVILHTPNRGNLAVKYQGREITRTDAQGVAHMIFRVAPNEVLSFQIDTSAQPLLRPQSPLVSISTRATDDAYVATVNFDDAPLPRAPRVRVNRGPGIQRIPSSGSRGF